MASTYTTSGVELITTGEQSGTWGDTTNTNWNIFDRMVNVTGDVPLSGTTHSLVISDGALSDGHYAVVNFTGSPSGTNTVTISPNDAKRVFYVTNSSGESVILTQGSGAAVTIADGDTALVSCDGAGSGAAVTDLTATFNLLAPGDIGSAVQAWDAQLDDIAALTPTDGNFIVGDGTNWVVESGATVLATLGVTATLAEINVLDGIANIGFSDGFMLIGANDSVQGRMVLYGGAAGNGGSIELFNGATGDGNIESYSIIADDGALTFNKKVSKTDAEILDYSDVNDLWTFHSPVSATLTAPVINGPVTGDVVIAEADWEAGTSTAEGVTSPAKVVAAITANKQILHVGPTATTSGSSFDVTDIPAWATEIFIVFDNVSLSSSGGFLIQLGTGGVLTTSGYRSSSTRPGIGGYGPTTGFGMLGSNAGAGFYGPIHLIRGGDTNKWVYNGALTPDGSGITHGAGFVELAGVLDIIRVGQSGGNTFDEGSFTVTIKGA